MGKQLVLAVFENEAAADGAVDALKGWDKATSEIKLGAIGVLVKDEKGKIKTHKVGSARRRVGPCCSASSACCPAASPSWAA